MGLLTDPNTTGQTRFGKMLTTWYRPLCYVMWIVGVVWFCALAHPPLNNGTYFSENALLPGLVRSEIGQETAVLSHSLLLELEAESERYPNGLPYPWLLAKMRQLGLEPHEHNFTLKHPLGNEPMYVGKNVYGVLRAQRASSMESFIVSAPYRPPTSHSPTTLPGIAAMLAFAEFARKQKYWSKDIIFLITEHEMLGAQAWLEAYHGVSVDVDAPTGTKGALRSGELTARAGAIQAAINLEIHDLNIDHIDLVIEGLNGQLPNLDLVNLVFRMCNKENIRNTFKMQPGSRNHRPGDEVLHWWKSLKTMMAMVLTQATGMPNGNHGLFHRFGIEAVTIEGFGYKDAPKSTPSLQLSRVLEGLCRSLNNLLERFHQSYFFYLLPASDRFVSIGYYMPVLGLLAGALLIKALAIWLIVQQQISNTENEAQVEESTTTTSTKVQSAVSDFNVFNIGATFLIAHCIGILLLNAPSVLTKIGLEKFHYQTGESLLYGYLILSILALFTPYVLNAFGGDSKYTADVLNITALIELASLLLCVGMYNFSMAVLAGFVLVPVALAISPRKRVGSGFSHSVCSVFWLALHPIVLLFTVISVACYYWFPEESALGILQRAVQAQKVTIAYGVVDSIVYGNWAFDVIAAILFPNWILFWQVLRNKQ